MASAYAIQCHITASLLFYLCALTLGARGYYIINLDRSTKRIQTASHCGMLLVRFFNIAEINDALAAICIRNWKTNTLLQHANHDVALKVTLGPILKPKEGTKC